MTPPDSGEREVWMAKKECPRCHGIGLVTMPSIPIAQVSLPLSLAQRVLAVLDAAASDYERLKLYGATPVREIAAELRAVMPKGTR